VRSFPPRAAVITGSLKQAFMVWMSDHARIYDMSMRLAASPIEPVSATSRSNSALPGPKAIFFPRMIRKRGDNEIESKEPVFFFMAQRKILANQRADLIHWNAARILKRFLDRAKMELRAGFVKGKTKGASL
jgi:hypothetical protein